MEEVWRDVVGYEDYFLVSNLGNVYSKRSGKLSKQFRRKNGYMTVANKIGGRCGKNVCFKVHRLVAEAFIPNPENKPFVNHLDSVRSNNTVENLEWVTPKENSEHAVKNGSYYSESCMNKYLNMMVLTAEDILYIKEVFIKRHRLFGARALARKFGVHHSTILNYV